MRWTDALKVGFAQAFALIPGTSRSGATIIGGLLFGLSRKAATEFSFFLAIPTLFAASGYELYKERALLSFNDWGMWAVGFVAAFVSAFLCVRWLLRYISSHDFTPVRLVPHRFRAGGPGYGLLGDGGLVRPLMAFAPAPGRWGQRKRAEQIRTPRPRRRNGDRRRLRARRWHGARWRRHDPWFRPSPAIFPLRGRSA